MRLYLAVAVLMLALVAYTEAQEEETVQQKFENFGQQMTEMGQSLAEKAKTTIEKFAGSDFAVKSRNWFSEQYEKMTAKVQELSQ